MAETEFQKLWKRDYKSQDFFKNLRLKYTGEITKVEVSIPDLHKIEKKLNNVLSQVKKQFPNLIQL
jgi:hypothetical protein